MSTLVPTVSTITTTRIAVPQDYSRLMSLTCKTFKPITNGNPASQYHILVLAKAFLAQISIINIIQIS